MTRRSRSTLLLFCLFASTAFPVRAQVPPETDPIESMPIRVGPLGLSPTLSITDIGIDTNVFNSAEDPQRDFTATIVPRLQARVRAGRMLLSGAHATGFVFYQDFADERSLNYSGEGRADIDLGRLKPFIGGRFIDTRERLNGELDIRAPRTQNTITAGGRFLLGSRSALVFQGQRSVLRFDQGVTFDGILLTQTLNSVTEEMDAGIDVPLTPLTTLSVTTSWQRDTFDESPDRDAESYRVTSTLRFDPIAILRGSFGIGYRRFDPVDPRLPDDGGLIVRANVSHTIIRTKVDLSATRDIQYSFEEAQPFYLTTNVRLTVTQQLAGPVDVQVLAGREGLAYRSALATDDRVDRIDLVGAGAGYRVRDNVRVGINWEHSRRASDRSDREYRRTRVFGSLTYGL